jgi:MoaA/NifB/PqqE/SkfB family radical SAM enzyme
MIEFDKIVRFGHVNMLKRDLFVVSWILGRYCNYHCSYCWPYANSTKKDHRPTELCLKTIDEIKRQARANGFNSFHFSLSGGEPTFHPGYLDILKHLADDQPNVNYSSIHMTTNLSQSMKWFEKYVQIAKAFDSVAITPSFHHEHVKGKQIDLFVDKLNFLQENNIWITINMVMMPSKFYELYDVAQLFIKNGINVTLKPQSDEKAQRVVDGYTDDMLKLLQEDLIQEPQIEMYDAEGNKYMFDQAERFNAFGFNNFQGWNCNSGYQSIIIREPDGSIKRSYSCRDEPLGNIKTGFKLFDKPKVCISPSCVSSADSKIPKCLP